MSCAVTGTTITVHNQSLDVSVSDIEINAVQVPLPGGYPFTPASDPGSGVGVNMSTASTVSVLFTWNANAIAGQAINVTDTTGVTQCIPVGGGGPTSTYTFSGVNMTGSLGLDINIADQPGGCP